MSTMRRRYVALVLVLIALVLVGALEMALARSGAHESTERRWFRMPSRDTGWEAHVALIDHALTDRDVTRAVMAWHDAYGAALASGRWEALVEVGDAFVRIGDAASLTSASRANARVAYLAALTRAQRDRSAEGVHRVARGFSLLGDHAVAAQCERIASRLTQHGGGRPG
jgi:hypothetical protein